MKILFWLLFLIGGTALAGPKLDFVVDTHGNRAVEVCKYKQDQKECGRIQLPTKMGTVRKLIAGEFVPGADASWLVLGKTRGAICVLRSTKLECLGLRTPSLAGIDIWYGEGPTRAKALAFGALRSTEADWKRIQKIGPLVSQAVTIVQARLDNKTALLPLNMTTLNATCSFTESDLVDEECEEDDWGDSDPIEEE